MWWMRPDRRGIIIKGIVPRKKNPPTLESQKKISLDLFSNRFWHPFPPNDPRNTTSRASQKIHAVNPSLPPVATPKKKTHNRAKHAKPQKLEVFSAEGRIVRKLDNPTKDGLLAKGQIVPKLNNPTKDGSPFKVGQKIMHSETANHGKVVVKQMVDFKYMAQMHWDGHALDPNEPFYECDKLQDLAAFSSSPRTTRKKTDFFTNHF